MSEKGKSKEEVKVVVGRRSAATSYPFDEIENNWQLYWDENRTFCTPDIHEIDTDKPKFYVLDMFPYPRLATLPTHSYYIIFIFKFQFFNLLSFTIIVELVYMLGILLDTLLLCLLQFFNLLSFTIIVELVYIFLLDLKECKASMFFIQWAGMLSVYPPSNTPFRLVLTQRPPP